MDAILNYVKSFLTLFLLIKILLFFVPQNGFSKYISFFSGVVLAIGILYPALEIFHLDESWLEQIYYDTFEEEMLEVSLSANYLQQEENEFYKQQAELFVENEIRAQVEAEGFAVEAVAVCLSSDYRVEKLSVSVTEGNEEVYVMLKEKLLKEYQLTEEQCEIWYE